jgi:glycolate oxidase subunit GlcD
MALTEQSIKFLKQTVGDQYFISDPTELKSLGCDWTKIYQPNPVAAVLPRTREDISAILSHCSEHGIAVVPSGGRTGLAGGAVASQQELVISMTRMNSILDIDSTSLTAEVEAGVTTQALQEAVSAKGVFFPVDLAAKGTSQIGGNIATNAGGLKLIRYGGMREQVLGLEVVLGNGDILDLNTSLRKNNTGYDLKQLFIGSEGTLGIVTKATLKLTTQPKCFKLVCIGIDSSDKITTVLERCHLARIVVTAFEFFTSLAHELVLEQFSQLTTPFDTRYPYYVLLEVEQSTDDDAELNGFLEGLFEDEIVVNAVVAQSSAEFDALWALRENITESLAAYGHVRKNDISVPTNTLSHFVAKLNQILGLSDNKIKIVLFGHVGDGNIHINYVAKKDDYLFADFNRDARLVEKKIFDLIKDFKGSISAEHGIGLLKVDDLKFSRTDAEIKMMRSIKRIFDPKMILNPGKIFPVNED